LETIDLKENSTAPLVVEVAVKNEIFDCNLHYKRGSGIFLKVNGSNPSSSTTSTADMTSSVGGHAAAVQLECSVGVVCLQAASFFVLHWSR
jgi:hypothetical protein